MPVCRLQFSSRLAASTEVVWQHASSMAGVNRELWPVRMSAPAGARIDEHTPLGVVAFHSVIALLGVLPLDLHALCLKRVEPGRGFEEESWSLLERRWVHHRRLTPVGGGTLVEDQLEFEPRLLAPLIQPIIEATFRRRHRRLQQIFGALS
jgi:ligand-binding SRPBCC domain-containing protein